MSTSLAFCNFAALCIYRKISVQVFFSSSIVIHLSKRVIKFIQFKCVCVCVVFFGVFVCSAFFFFLNIIILIPLVDNSVSTGNISYDLGKANFLFCIRMWLNPSVNRLIL